MEKICEIVPSPKDWDELHIPGWLMVKDKYLKANNYKCCENRESLNCNNPAISRLSNKQHILTTFVGYKHSSNTSQQVSQKSWESENASEKYKKYPLQNYSVKYYFCPFTHR
jgi:hypothetical protein